MYQFPRGGVDSPVVVGVVFLGGIIMEHLHQLCVGAWGQQLVVQLEHVRHLDTHERLRVHARCRATHEYIHTYIYIYIYSTSDICINSGIEATLLLP